MRHGFGWVVILVIASLHGCGGTSNRDQLAASQTPAPSGALFTSAPSGVTLVAGAAASNYSIGGGVAPYTASATDERVATGRVAGSTLTISPLAMGTIQVLVSDAAGKQVPITVTVAGASPNALAVAAPSTVSIQASVVPASYALMGGSPPYTAETSNALVATATVSGNQLNIKGLILGSTKITVFDAAGAQASLTVNVVSSSGVPLTVAPNGATGLVGDVLTFTLRGGSPGYTLSTNNTTIASLSTNSAATSGDTFTVKLNGVGDAVITVSDAQSQVTSFTITAGATTPQLRLAPATFLIGENNVNPVALNVYGGTPPYTAITSDLLKASVSVVGNVVSTSPGSSATRCINPVSDDKPPVYVPSGIYAVTITVIDALGATGTSVMSIKDNGAGLDLGCP